MPRFRRKMGTVEAFRMGQKGEPTPAPEWFGSPKPEDILDNGIIIRNGRVVQVAYWGWWVIKHSDDSMQVMSDDVFRQTYELVEE